MSGKLKTYFIDLRNEFPLLRCVFGVTLALVFATTMAYPSPHLTAILTFMFLGPGKQPMGLKKEILVPATFFVLGSIGVIVGHQLIDYPFVVLPLLALAIFWSFKLTKIPHPIRLIFLILIVLIPFSAIKANILGNMVLYVLLINVIFALIVARISFFLFPDKKMAMPSPSKQEPSSTPGLNMDKVALNGLIVIFPIVFLFYVFNAKVGILTLVFTVLLGFDPFIYRSKKGLALILANVFGGVAGVIAYNLLVIAPNLLFYIFLSTSVAFFFVINLFSGKKTAPIFATSFNTFLVIMGIISTSTSEAGSELWARLAQIGIAIVYVVPAYKIVTFFNDPNKNKIEE